MRFVKNAEKSCFRSYKAFLASFGIRNGMEWNGIRIGILNEILNRIGIGIRIRIGIGHFWDFFQSQFPREIYVQSSSNQAKNTL